MSFLEKISEFLTLVKESNFDLGLIYSQNPNGIYIVVLIILVLLLIAVFFIKNAFKKSELLRLVSKVQNSSDFDEFDRKLSKIAFELPKRGVEVASSLNVLKEDILTSQLALLKDFSIKKKIKSYKQISSVYSLIAANSKKYKNEELTKYYENKSRILLDENLKNEIETYYKNISFKENDIKYVNSIVAFANTLENPESILTPLQEEINRFSFAFNLDLFKFVKALTKEESGKIFINCNEKINSLFENSNIMISENILAYMMEIGQKEKVYEYISNLKNPIYLQSLYYRFFAKVEDDINLDLAFVKNETQINENYKEHLDNKITFNWKDLGLIKHILNAPRVLETIGHIDYRNVLERIEKLENEVDYNAKVAEILEIARRAETIAKEAKAIARSSK
ncbi:hypothetical protein [Arcobacter sp. s6]|jgi:hypothetical protein|uniref:hypothetical protein n=1 Tax=Arcobacter sp. s6 TaxID=3230363 RepID=UPI0034A08642